MRSRGGRVWMELAEVAVVREIVTQPFSRLLLNVVFGRGG